MIYYVTTDYVNITQHQFNNDVEAVVYFRGLRVRIEKGMKLDKSDRTGWHEYNPDTNVWVKVKRSRDTSYLHTRVQDMLSAHRTYKGTSEQLTMKYLYLRKNFNVPDRTWTYFDGWVDCQRQMFYRYDLRFGYEIDGKVYPMLWDAMPEEHKQLARENKLVGNHYWVNDKGELTKNKWS